MTLKEVLDTGALVAACATLVTAVIAGMTLKEMARQRRAASRPRLSLDDLHAEIFGEEFEVGFVYPNHWALSQGKATSILNPPVLNDQSAPWPWLNLWNVGLGSAIDVRLTFVFNVPQEIERMNGRLRLLPVDERFSSTGSDKVIVFNSGESNRRFPSSLHAVKGQMTRKYPAIGPTHTKAEASRLYLPPFYYQILNAHLYVLYKHIPPVGFSAPGMRVRLEYRDIEDQEYMEEFDLTPQFIGGSRQHTNLQILVQRV